MNHKQLIDKLREIESQEWDSHKTYAKALRLLPNSNAVKTLEERASTRWVMSRELIRLFYEDKPYWTTTRVVTFMGLGMLLNILWTTVSTLKG